eukprot:snap_masked-scaffold_66-processed-gene-0.17-mRNA-1 protein AED:1.00 eAED:1.00 QI:0/0/0/0/1/1/2/0/102
MDLLQLYCQPFTYFIRNITSFNDKFLDFLQVESGVILNLVVMVGDKLVKGSSLLFQGEYTFFFEVDMESFNTLSRNISKGQVALNKSLAKGTFAAHGLVTYS